VNPELKKRLDHLDGLTDLHLDVCAQMLKADSGKMFPLDILASATIKRSLALIKGFTTLVKIHNYSCAASLLRLQIDSCLRLFAAFIVDKPHDLASNVLKGKAIRNMKDRNGNRMTDRHLVNTLASKYEWLPRVYESTSGFIHLSEKHLFSVFDEVKGERTVGLRVGADDKNFPPELWIELADGFLAATEALFEYLKGWVFTKENAKLVAKLRKEMR
jgi:hypothetical protein